MPLGLLSIVQVYGFVKESTALGELVETQPTGVVMLVFPTTVATRAPGSVGIGEIVCLLVGVFVGGKVGLWVGTFVGSADGVAVGAFVGARVSGAGMGALVGAIVGTDAITRPGNSTSANFKTLPDALPSLFTMVILYS